MKQCGRVVRIDGDRLTVFPDGARGAGCSGGHCAIAGRTVQVSNPAGVPVQVSDRVEIATSLRRGLLDFFLLILLPLGTALLAAFPLSSALGLREVPVRATLALGCASLVVGVSVLRSPENRMRSLPTLTTVLNPDQ